MSRKPMGVSWSQYRINITTVLVLVALLLLTACGSSPQISAASPSADIEESAPSLLRSRSQLQKVAVPQVIEELAPWLEQYRPQVDIRQPRTNQVLEDTHVRVELQVKDLPIYKDDIWELGPHLDLLLDNQPYGSIYDLGQPIVLEDLSPGTHTLRAFAVRPWNESFKNEGAYDQVTFHIFAKSEENAPPPDQPLLTYGSPMGTYGAEPILLDFYLTDAPLHQVAQTNPAIDDWQVRYTINGESITLDNWEPTYIEGLKPGRNWIQLTLVDTDGNAIAGVFNTTVRLIDYDPTVQNGLAQLVQGDVPLEQVGTIVDPSYEPPVPEFPEAQPVGTETADPDIEPETIEPEIVEPDVDSKTLEPETLSTDAADRLNVDSLENAPPATDPTAVEIAPPDAKNLDSVMNDSRVEQSQTIDSDLDKRRLQDLENGDINDQPVAPATSSDFIP